MAVICHGLIMLSKSSADPGNDIEELLACLIAFSIPFASITYRLGISYLYSAMPNLTLNITIQNGIA